jgi:GT2 family glycosyltransferase
MVRSMHLFTPEPDSEVVQRVAKGHSTNRHASPKESVPKYSIIIVNFNGGTMLAKCLDSVFQHTADFELVLVDNNSTDQSSEEALVRFPTITLVKNARNVGFAKANNVGIMKAKGDWKVLLNPDTIVTSHWLVRLIECATSPRLGLVGPKLVRLDKRTIDSTGLMFNPKSGLSYDRGSGEADEKQFDRAEPVPCCSFACVAIRGEVIQTVGLLDERMVLYFDDIDYCIRARVAGWEVWYCPTSVVLHSRGGVTPKSSIRLQRQAVAYRLRIMLKCYDRRNAIKYGLARIIRDVLSAMAGVKNNDVEYFLGYLRSPLWNLLNLPIQERRVVQSGRKATDEILFQRINNRS